MTGAPIYLVSACASGEEFVAAFRRYADKHGLFVPISEPLPAGARARFAVTLKDGGVMIEGEAEIVGSARTASPLHGRVGMTLRFVDPDAPSKTVLAELEKARLAMRPAPPSVAPRPAELPAEPRAVAPPPHGRIDATNALAECVAIGDTRPLGSLPPLATAPAPKAAAKFVVPSIPMAPASGRTKPATTPPAVGLAPPRSPDVPPPAVRPVAGLSQTMAAAPVDPGPISDTLIAATPPMPPIRSASQPESLDERRGDSETMVAVPLPSMIPPSSPTDVGGVLVEPLPALEPEPERPALEVAAGTPAREDESQTQIHAGAPRPTTDETPVLRRPDTTVMPPPGAGSPHPFGGGLGERAGAFPTLRGIVADLTQTLRSAPPEMAEVSAMLRATEIGVAPIARPTEAGMPPIPRGTEIGMPPVARGPAPVGGAPAPAPPIVAPEQRAALPEVEIAEPTDLSQGPPEPPAAFTPSEPRRTTAIGVAVTPPSVDPADEPTGADRAILDDPGLDGTVPQPRLPSPAVEEPTPSEAWVMPGPEPRPPIATSAEPAGRPATPPPGPPTGDWMIALDPEAPDGWSEPIKAVKASASQPRTKTPAAPAAASPTLVGTAGPPAGAPSRPSPIPSAEPKVQIDPTLIQPLQAVPPPDPERSSEPDPPMMYSGPGAAAVVPAAMSVGPMQPPGSFAPPPGAMALHPAQPPAYPMDPSYQMVPAPAAGAAYLASASGSGFGDPRYSSAAIPAHPDRHRLIIVLASALVAVLIGILVLLITGNKEPVGPASGTNEPRPRSTSTTFQSDPAPPPARAAARQAPAASAASSTPAPPAEHAAPAAPAAARPAPEPRTCFAEVSSSPTGAEIVLDGAGVIGTTPQKVTLPCDARTELTVRKGRLVPVTRGVTATPDGVKLKVALAKPTFLVKVSSMPAGATITWNGKQLGVTPTTVKLPSFESSTLSIAKDGFAAQTEKITPRSSGVAVHTKLERLGRKKPR